MGRNKSTSYKNFTKEGVWLERSELYVRTASSFGRPRTCRLCGTKVDRGQAYLNLDRPGYRGHLQTGTSCQACTENLITQIRKANDLQRDSTSKFS